VADPGPAGAVAHALILLAWGWGGAGAAVAAAFLLGGGIERVEPAARGAYAVRPLLLPGIVLLWPLVLWRWVALIRRGR
jgi:hypothetical protein